MTAYNVVRFRVKPGRDKEFLEKNRQIGRDMKGFHKGAVIKTGESSYCFIGEWTGMNDIAAARSQMIKNLDSFRDLLEDLGNGLGVTDPISGDAIIEIRPAG